MIPIEKLIDLFQESGFSSFGGKFSGAVSKKRYRDKCTLGEERGMRMGIQT